MRSINGQFINKRRQNLGCLVGLVLVIILIWLLWPIGIKNNSEANAVNCAVWGYESDCKTPLTK